MRLFLGAWYFGRRPPRGKLLRNQNIPCPEPEADQPQLSPPRLVLCVTHHKAYDDALITFDEMYCLHINDEKIEELTRLGLIDELGKFRDGLPRAIALPANKKNHPDKKYIEVANKLRGWKL